MHTPTLLALDATSTQIITIIWTRRSKACNIDSPKHEDHGKTKSKTKNSM
jgi:hypothetical protein